MSENCSIKLCCGTHQAIHLVLSISPVPKVAATQRKGKSKGRCKLDAQDGGKTTASEQAASLATM